MERSEFRVLIKHCFLMGKNTVHKKKWLDKFCGESSPKRQTIEKWIGEFKWFRTSTNDAKRLGRPKDVTTPEIIEKIHDIILSGVRIIEILQIEEGRYTLYHSFICPKFQLPIKSPEVTIFEKQCLTKIMKRMRWQKLQLYIKCRR